VSEVVNWVVDAFNRRDLDAFAAGMRELRARRPAVIHHLAAGVVDHERIVPPVDALADVLGDELLERAPALVVKPHDPRSTGRSRATEHLDSRG
jgi:hypothetical protein